MQPWASLVAMGAKKLETRSWSTHYRGPLAIHASRGLRPEAREWCRTEPFRSALVGLDPDTLPRGAIVAVCELVDCIRITPGNVPEDPERAFGDYAPGRWAWQLEEIRRLPEPIPAKGALGLWEWRGELWPEHPGKGSPGAR